MSTITWPTFPRATDNISINAPNPFQWLTHMNRLKQDGYTIFKQLLPQHIFDPLNSAFDELKSATLQPVGIVTHPLFWQTVFALHPIIEKILTEPYVILPETWAWDIAPNKTNKGWAPHREKLFSCVKSDGMPTSISCWFPITAATPDNSCMYVLPAADDPYYPVGKTRFEYPLQSIRALPAIPGDVIVFNHNILHWGSQSSQWGTTPRRAIAFESQIASSKPYNTPTITPLTCPTRDEQQTLYHQLIKQYDHIDY
ncbi:MAG: phytanoyl-CoA dioxygenase family protein [Candidatus Marinamargulisbacteria bacterium]